MSGTAQSSAIDSEACLPRGLLLLPVSLSAVVGLVWDEVLLASPIIFLVETLGFLAGAVVFTLGMASLGLACLALAEFAWPRMVPGVNRVLSSVRDIIAPFEFKRYKPARKVVPIVAAGFVMPVVVLGVGTCLVLFGSATANAIADNAEAVAVGSLAIVGLLILLLLLNLVRQQVESWATKVAHATKARLRPVATALAMLYLGPVLGWPAFRLLGYTRGKVYMLTLASAPLFSAIWVPYYALGVWNILRSVWT